MNKSEAKLDLEAIENRRVQAVNYGRFTGDPACRLLVDDVPSLIARVRDLEEKIESFRNRLRGSERGLNVTSE